jgi:hypothetical protein
MDAGAGCVYGAAFTEDEVWEEGGADSLQGAWLRGAGAVPHLWQDLSLVLGGISYGEVDRLA